MKYKYKQKYLLFSSLFLLALGFVIISNVFLVFGQTSYPQWRGTSNIKAPYLAENLEWLKSKIDGAAKPRCVNKHLTRIYNLLYRMIHIPMVCHPI